MADQEEVERPVITPERRLEFIKEDSLRSIRTEADSLRRYLQDYIDTATSRLEALNAGHGIQLAGAFGLGPFGHQLPADVNKTAIILKQKIDAAHMAGATDEEILEAQKGWGL
jgi:hypothetical protein